MVEIDWINFMGVKPGNLTEQEKDDFYNTVTWYTPDFNLDRKYLIHFIRIVQEVLKYKGEQVELLTNELDDLAAKQGKEEANKFQQYIEQVEHLKEELEYQKKLSQGSTRSPYASNDELKRDIVKLEMHNEELLNELNEKEKDLLNEKEEVERYAAQVATLEREKQELSRELRVLQEETMDRNSGSMKESPEIGTEKQELTEVIRQKNKHISQLLEDIEVIEEENISLRNKLTGVRDELSETTTQINEITAELAKLKHLNEEYENRNIESEQRIKSLTCQIEELVEEKSKYDKQLDDYIVMFNTKLKEWKNEIENKDEEIIKLKEDMKKLSSPRLFTSNSSERDLQSKIMQQAKEIKILQQELKKAIEEINSSTELIEKLKEKQIQLMAVPLNAHSIKFFEEKIKVLEEKLVYAEEDAHMKAEEMSDLVIQLREYEAGVFGLSEAVVKIKKLEKNLQEKDLQIEKLVEICNCLEIKLDNFEEQNISLRERLGLSVSEEIDTSGVKLRYRKDAELLETLKLQLNQKEEELIKSKMKYRKAIKFLKLYPLGGEEKHGPNGEIGVLNDKLQSILKENDALRKGMHEVLESIRDSSGSVEVHAASLQRLLEALDSRHISGWYHPAMRLQAQLSTEEGKNEELRNQIRSLRSEERKRASELRNAYLKIQTLEYDLSTPRCEEVEVTQTKSLEHFKEFGQHEPSEQPKQTEHLEHSQQFEEPDQPASCKQLLQSETKTAFEIRIMKLESNLREQKLEFDRRQAELESQAKVFNVEKENLLIKITELECQNNQLKSENPDLAEISEKISQVVVLERQVSFLKNLETASRTANEKLKHEMIEDEEEMLKDILKLQKEKSVLLTTIDKLEKDVLNSVTKEKYEVLVKDLANAETKYRNAVGLALVGEQESSADLRAEVQLLEKEKQELMEQLRLAKEKLIASEALAREELVTNGDLSNEVSALSRRLALSEVQELNEKQKALHLEKLNEILKAQQEEVEARNKELLSQVMRLTEEKEKLTEAEMELRMLVLTQASEAECESLNNQVKSLQKKCEDLMAEKDNVQELFEISQGQCRAFQQWKDADRILLASSTEQILLLQSSDEDKANISRLSHELAMAKLTASQLTKKNSDLKIKVTKLLSENLSLELKAGENRREYVNEKKKLLTLTGHLYKAIYEIRSLYGSVIPFRHVEDIYNAKLLLKNKKKEVMDRENELRKRIHEYTLKKEEMETQLEGLQDLKEALKGDAKTLVAWHNKSTELRLKEAKWKRQNDFLLGEVAQLEERVRKLDAEISSLEEGSIEKEKEWERKQMFWEEAQLELCRLLQEKGFKKKKCCEMATNTEFTIRDVFHSENLNVSEKKIRELEAETVRLRKEHEEKEALLMTKEMLLNSIGGKAKTIELEETISAEKMENAEKEALKMTIRSLQSIIKQKEETILRYQDLLKESREEYSRACGKLQQELRCVNETLTSQRAAYNKLKAALQNQIHPTENISGEVEKYVTKIQELEEELRDCEINLASANAEVCSKGEEVERWRKMAEESSAAVEDLRQRLNGELKSDLESRKEEMTKYQKEIERLNEIIELLHVDQVKEDQPEVKLMNSSYFPGTQKGNSTDHLPQEKALSQESIDIHLKSDQLSDCTFDKPQRQRKEHMLRELETTKRQLKFSKEESARLREQIRLLQLRPQRRSKGSSTTRSESKSSVKEDNPSSKIKHLEELLTLSKEREKELMDINLKKLRSTEEVARWDERKKSQQALQNLTTKLKEKEAEVEVLRNKNESFRNMVYKCERDKVLLESQLKAVKGGPGGVNARVEKLTWEKQELETEISSLRTKLEEQIRHASGFGAVLLHEKLEEQERKLVSYELASMGQNKIMEELDRLKMAYSNLEKENLRLESENLALQLKLEKEKVDVKSLLDKARHVQGFTEEMKQQETKKVVSNLRITVEKLIEENKRLKALPREPRNHCLEKLRKDLAKLREEYNSLKEKYSEVVDKNAALQEELKSSRFHIHLLEEKDFAEALTRTSNFQVTSELSEELIEVKAKLAHKTQLLSRVKGLLVKAAAKEKVLLQQVSALQNLAPQGELHFCG